MPAWAWPQPAAASASSRSPRVRLSHQHRTLLAAAAASSCSSGTWARLAVIPVPPAASSPSRLGITPSGLRPSAGHHLELLFLITARGSLAAGRFFGRAALRRRQGLPAMTTAASCSARRCSPMPATSSTRYCWSVLRARGSPPAPRAGRDDCSGFVFGSAVLADGRAALFSAGMTRREPGGVV